MDNEQPSEHISRSDYHNGALQLPMTPDCANRIPRVPQLVWDGSGARLQDSRLVSCQVLELQGMLPTNDCKVTK